MGAPADDVGDDNGEYDDQPDSVIPKRLRPYFEDERFVAGIDDSSSLIVSPAVLKRMNESTRNRQRTIVPTDTSSAPSASTDVSDGSTARRLQRQSWRKLGITIEREIKLHCKQLEQLKSVESYLVKEGAARVKSKPTIEPQDTTGLVSERLGIGPAQTAVHNSGDVIAVLHELPNVLPSRAINKMHFSYFFGCVCLYFINNGSDRKAPAV